MRKIIALVLATFLLIPTTLTASGTNQAFAASRNAEKVIKALNIMETDQGEIKSTVTKITRAQFAQLLVNISDQKEMIAVSNTSLFKDVKKNYWAAPYIRTAVNRGWMSGYLNGTFKPEQGLTLIEAVNGVLNLLGYTDSYFSGNLTQSKLAFYKAKKMNNNIKVTKASSYIDYEDCVNLLYNTLNTANKDGRVYAEVLGYSLDSRGEVDYVSVINTGTDGPIIAKDNWSSDLPFRIDTATVYRNDAKVSYTDIEKYDVIYYSESFKTIWAYDSKVTGVISAINPDLINPTSVTLAGVEYKFETSEASVDFASMGQFEKGDVVTLLLGKNGGIAGALSSDEYNTTVTGLVLGVGTHLVLNEDGNYVSSGYVTFVDARGNKYTQDYNSNTLYFTEGNLIRIKYENGKATVSKLSMQAPGWNNSTVDSTGKMLGSMKLATDIHILDYSNGSYKTIYPARLANTIIMDSSVLYYQTNFDHEITDLILKNVTGDLDSYGIYTGYSSAGSSGTYNYILNGTEGKLSKFTYADFTTTTGPVGFSYEGGNIVASYSLKKLPVSDIGTSTITSGSVKYPLAENMSVYVLSDGAYSLSSLNKINLSKYTVTAYIDKAISLGGRVRILIAEPIK